MMIERLRRVFKWVVSRLFRRKPTLYEIYYGSGE
jgi:hypothetical protein